jgi:ligand-binding sensor domain-containing protein/anti-sigma regulatory factor (Ser/Thr protein kinase)
MKKLLLILFLILGISTQAQNNELRGYTLADGLPQSQVYAMVQDTIGYLWIGTQGGGLARFDGNDFTVFTEKDSLASNYIESLASRGDQLFIGTKKGLSIYTKGRITSIKTPKINAVYPYKEQVFLATDKGMFVLDSFGNLSMAPLSPSLNSSVLRDVLFDGTDFWIASKKGLYKTKSLTKRSPISQLETVEFNSIVKKDNKVYAASFVDGILVYDISEAKQRTIIIPTPIRINRLSIQNNELWVATDNDGVTILDAESLSFQKNINLSNGLTVAHVRQTLLDKQGNIWLGTSGGGLYKYFPNQFTHFDKETGLKGNRIYAVHAAKNALWFSAAEKGLSYIDSLGIKNLPVVEGFENIKIKALTSDENGNIWAGSEGKGILYRQTKKRDSFIVSGNNINDIVIDTISITKTKYHLINNSKGLPSNWIRDIIYRDGTTWAATYGTGIVRFKYDTETNEIKNLQTFDTDFGIEDLQIKDLFKDPRTNAVWYSTQQGHLGFINDKVSKHLGQVLPQATAINSIAIRDKSMFLGTGDAGIWVGNLTSTPVFKKLKGAKKTSSQNSFQLIFDAQGNLWTGSERGIDKIVLNSDLEIVDVFHYGRNDGFLSIETCLNAAALDSDTNLWFGGIYGLTKYNSTQIKAQTEQKPTLHFEQITAGYIPIDSLPKTAWKENILQLVANNNQLSFSYKTVDINHPNAIEYRYKLDTQKWSPWSQSNRENLAGLAFGKHEFTAQSRNYRWQESNPIAFHFMIETPLLKQMWFQCVLILVLILCIAFVIVSYIKRFKNKNYEAQKQLELQNHLLGLEQKALRLQMNPHFIFNVLNGIKAMGSTNPSKMNKTINSFAKLMRGILTNSRQNTISLQEEVTTLKNYIDVELLMAPKPFLYDIKVESDIALEEIAIPPMLIQPIVENAIRHGVLKLGKEGILSIMFKTSETSLQCRITDNGPGIFTTQQQKAKTSHHSIALEVTKERITSLANKDTLQLRELKKNNIVLGTEVSFTIPLELDF